MSPGSTDPDRGPPPADLARDTEVRPVPGRPGIYTADLSAAWDFLLPSGGVHMAIALRAMAREIGDPELRIASATTLFCSPVPAGPVRVEVVVLRRGATTAQARAALFARDEMQVGLEVSGTFALPRSGPEVLGLELPEGPSPAEAPPLFETPRWPFFHNLEVKLARGHRWWEQGWEPGPARCDRWIRYRVPQRLESGELDPFCLPAIADLVPPALMQALGPTQDRFYAPSLDLTMHFLEPTRSEWILTVTRCQHAKAGYATSDVEMWDDQGRLVATSSQVMYLRRAPAEVGA